MFACGNRFFPAPINYHLTQSIWLDEFYIIRINLAFFDFSKWHVYIVDNMRRLKSSLFLN